MLAWKVRFAEVRPAALEHTAEREHHPCSHFSSDEEILSDLQRGDRDESYSSSISLAISISSEKWPRKASAKTIAVSRLEISDSLESKNLINSPSGYLISSYRYLIES